MKKVKSFLVEGLGEARFVKSSETVLVIVQGVGQFTDVDTGESKPILNCIELSPDGSEIIGACRIGSAYLVNRISRVPAEKLKNLAFKISPNGQQDLGKGRVMNVYDIEPFVLEPSDLETLGLTENSSTALPEPAADPELPAVHPEREKVNPSPAGVDPNEDTIF